MKKFRVPFRELLNRPVVDWVAMKAEAYRRLDLNNHVREMDEDLRKVYPRLGDHVYKTVEKLLTLFRKKYERGELGTHYSLRFTYSYFKRHADSRYCLRTFMNHFSKLTEAYKSIFRTRMRSTLQLPGRDCNCVLIEFAEGIIQFTNPRFNGVASLSLSSMPVMGEVHARKQARIPSTFGTPAAAARERGGTFSAADALANLKKDLGFGSLF